MAGNNIRPIPLLLLIVGFASRASALELVDDFSGGSQAWVSESGWSATNVSPGVFFYRCASAQNTHAWRRFAPLASTWEFRAEVKFRTLFGSSGTRGVASLGLSRDAMSPSAKILIDLIRRSSGTIRIMAAYYGVDGVWYNILDSTTLSVSPPEYVVRVQRVGGSNTLQVSVQAANGFSYAAQTAPLPPHLRAGILVPGFRVDSAIVDFANVRILSPSAPSPQSQSFQMLATNVVSDLLNNFWRGDPTNGQIVNTWNGYTNGTLPDARGALWERAMLYLVLDNFDRFQSNAIIRQMLLADWNRTKGVYSSNQLEACGQDSGANWAVDDAGWSALMYLAAYRATADPAALDRAKGLVNCSFDRWMDNQLGGGMWYRDLKDIKSLYQAAVVMASFRIFELTGEQSFFDRAMSCCVWMETYLLRPDGLYWVDYDVTGPIGKGRPDDIHEAGSVVSLGGAMAMGVLHARLYRMTSNNVYRLRAIRTAEALANRLVTVGGLYLNDRDAWTQGVFAGDWAREVLSLPGIAARHLTLLRTTADSIYTHARTNGLYGGSWSGPATGAGSRWWEVGSRPEQIMTSSSSANLIVSASVNLDPYNELLRPTLQIAGEPTDNLHITLTGEPGWAHLLEISTNLVMWISVTNLFPDPFLRTSKWQDSNAGVQKHFRVSVAIPP
jgi:hypothetical protein